MKASKKQRLLLGWLEDFLAEHDYAPSYREIAAGLDYKSVSTVAVHIDNLVAMGYLRKVENAARSLEVVGLHNNQAAPNRQSVVKELENLAAKVGDDDVQYVQRTIELLREQIEGLESSTASPQ